MNKSTFIASFSTGSLLDITGVFNPLVTITSSDIIQFGYNLVGLLVSGFVAAIGAYLFGLIRRKYLDRKKNEKN